MQSGGIPTTADEDHLNLLSIFHRILGGMLALGACIPCAYVAIAALFLSIPFHSAPPEATKAVPNSSLWAGGIAAGLFAGLLLLAWAFAICVFAAGGRLAKRSRYNFCLVVACLECTITPLGTALGVFTLIVLMRPSVKALFGKV